jgi:hypothetical protein
LCNHCLSQQKLGVRIPLMAGCTWYNIMWSSLLVTCGRSVVFSRTPVSSTNKTDHHNLIEMLLKVALKTITLTHMWKNMPLHERWEWAWCYQNHHIVDLSVWLLEVTPLNNIRNLIQPYVIEFVHYLLNCLGGVMVSLLILSVLGRRFNSCSSPTKDYKLVFTGVMCLLVD